MKHRTFGADYLCGILLLLLCLASSSGAQAPEVAALKKPVTLHETVVFQLHCRAGGQPCDERARRASQALAAAAAQRNTPEVEVKRSGERVVIAAAGTPIVELQEEDARLAGYESLDTHAASLASRMRSALESERRRQSVANTVFSVSLVVFFGLVTLYLIGRTAEFVRRARGYVVAHPDLVPALRLKSLDVVGAASVRNALLVLLGVGRWAAQFGLAYAWLVLSLSLFEATRPYTEKLTGFVLAPLTALVGRVASALPLFAIVLAAAAALAVLVRLADLFFESVERGETTVSWVLPDVALATGRLVRLAIALFALVVVGPVITGEPDGALSRIGMVLLVALAAAAVPALASVMAGLGVVFSRTVRPGDRVVYGGESGVVLRIGLVWLTLEAEEGASVRVPHARALWHATRVLSRSGR